MSLASLLRLIRDVVSGAWEDLGDGGRVGAGVGGSDADRDVGSAGPGNLRQIPGETGRANFRTGCLGMLRGVAVWTLGGRLALPRASKRPQ